MCWGFKMLCFSLSDADYYNDVIRTEKIDISRNWLFFDKIQPYNKQIENKNMAFIEFITFMIFGCLGLGHLIPSNPNGQNNSILQSTTSKVIVIFFAAAVFFGWSYYQKTEEHWDFAKKVDTHEAYCKYAESYHYSFHFDEAELVCHPQNSVPVATTVIEASVKIEDPRTVRVVEAQHEIEEPRTVQVVEVQHPIEEPTSASIVEKVPAKTFAPSFNCAKASINSELLICSNEELAKADVNLARIYRFTMSNTIYKETLKTTQKNWLKNIRDVCTDIKCMLDVYNTRINELSNYQITTLDSAPSFDCTKASTSSEYLICSNKELAYIDVKLAKVYKLSLENSINKEEIKKTQKNWLRNVRDSCRDATCMLDAYNSRIDYLSSYSSN